MSDSMSRETGMIRNINLPQRTFGFVTNGAQEWFFHWSDFNQKSDKPFHHLKVGDAVTFTPSSNGDKQVAKDIHFKYIVDTRKKKPAFIK